MLPKIQAILWFLEQGGTKAIITRPENLKHSLQGQGGTLIELHRPVPQSAFVIGLEVNGEEKVFTGNKDMPLLVWLRDVLGITSAKDGCSGQGACGACLVEINGRPSLACRTQMKKLAGSKVVTIEGFDPDLKDLLAKAFVKTGAIQCGFCTPGFLTRAKILLDQVYLPTDDVIKKRLGAHLCRCTGYAKIIDAVMLAAKARSEEKQIQLDDQVGVGQSQSKHDAFQTALGKREFVDDMRFDSMVHGSLKFSDHPRARVLKIDTTEAEKLPGVIRVFTASDIPGDRMTGVIVQDWPMMVKEGEITRYIGDVLAGVVAQTDLIAWKACNLIKVDYEVLEPVLDPVEALNDTIKVHENGNLFSTTEFTRGGDVQEAFDSSDYVVSAQYQTQLVEHGFLETEACIAKPLPNEAIQVFTQSQGIYEDRHTISSILGLRKEDVVATLVPCGGAFGGKEDLTVQGHAALFCHHLKLPVKVSLTREDSIRMHVKRHPFIMDYTLGCDKKGQLTALSAKIIGDTGAYASLGGEVLNRAAGHAAGGYHVPVVDVVSKAVYTNNLPAGAMRGFGVNQVTFAMECMMDELCEKAGLDPWQFRYDNALEKGKMTATGQVLGEGVGLKKTLMALKGEYTKAKYAGLALGIKNIGFGNGLIDESEVIIEVVSETQVVIHHGWTEMGQGIDTVAKQMFNEVFDLPGLDIQVVSSTDSEAVGGTTTASRGTFLMGNSLLVAAEKMKKELEIKSLSKIVGKSFKGRWFSDWTNKPGKDVDKPVTHFAYGYAAQLVILDDDGKVEKVVAAHDAGKVMNPNMFEGQIEGAVAMGLGYAFKEKLELDKGYLKSDKLVKLGMPKIKDMPKIEVIAVEEKDPNGPFGAKGVGEIGLVPTAPAAINALYQYDKKRRYTLPIGRKIR
ncbi:MAG: selenium-dependent xanthine dehydrogenase [bacterium]|nr:selenium-dependent xanthine dehydrogenase [bacterium]